MRYTLFAGSYFGIPVRIHFTFPLILILFGVEAWTEGGWFAAVRAVLLILSVFVCVVLHEFGHSLQVKRYGIRVRDVVLLPIGGMARAERIPEKPWQEIVVAISGPIVNFALAAIMLVIIVARGKPMDLESDFVTNLLAINLVLGTFNLIPAYPMDGGRILRGLLALKLPYLRATRFAKNVGQMIALGFVVAGFMENTFIMLPVIAVFIYLGAINEENAIRVRIELKGKTARDMVDPGKPVLASQQSIESARAVFVRAGNPPALAVAEENRSVFGMVKDENVSAALSRGEQESPVSSVAVYDFHVISAQMPAAQAYYFLKAEKQNSAAVIEDGFLIGLVYFESFLEPTN